MPFTVESRDAGDVQEVPSNVAVSKVLGLVPDSQIAKVFPKLSMPIAGFELVLPLEITVGVPQNSPVA